MRSVTLVSSVIPVVSAIALAAFAAPYGVDVRVNDPTLDRPEGTTQSEPSLAVHGSTICAGYNNTRRGPVPNPLAGFARSTDRGATWTDRGFTHNFRYSDPVLVAHHATGWFFYADIITLTRPGVGTVIGIGVARSTDDCNTFPTVALASTGSLPQDMQDKPWIAVDNSGTAGDGNVYACWTRFGATAGDLGFSPSLADAPSDLRFSRSTDGGRSFGTEQVLSPPTDFYPFGCHINVGPHGEVYVAWSDRGTFFPVRFRRSLDSGVTWEPAVQVNTFPIREPGTDRFMTCEPGQIRPTLNGDIRMLPIVGMAVDTSGGSFDGNIYVVWASDPTGDVDNSDIYFSRSTNGGLSWGPEVQIGAGSDTDQFLPTVEVGGTGTVSVAWYDRRNDAANNFLIDVYSAYSRDGGATMEPIVRISDASFPVPPITAQPSATGNFDPGRSACYMGDYIAVAADRDYFYYAWGDNRNTVVSITYPNGRPDPDVYFDRRLASCGDTTIDAGEQCDDGNLVDGDGCDANCTFTACGNGVVTAGERCDDGNRLDGDGCDALCQIGLTFTPTATASSTPSPTPTSPAPCACDCDRNHAVTIDEVLTAVNLALSGAEPSACPNADVNRDRRVTVDEILRGVQAALTRCE